MLMNYEMLDININNLERFSSSIPENQRLIICEKSYSKMLEFATEHYYVKDFYASLHARKFLHHFFVSIKKPSDINLLRSFSNKDNIDIALGVLLDDFILLPDIFYFYLYKDKDVMKDIPYGKSLEKILGKYLAILISFQKHKIGYNDVFFHEKNYSEHIIEYSLSWLYEENMLDKDTIILFSEKFKKKYDQLKLIISNNN